MSKFCFLFAILLGIFSNLKAQKLSFSYDPAGNQTERRWVCINCPPGSSVTEQSNKVELGVLTSETSKSERKIKVSPNPVTEVLNVMWLVPKEVNLLKMEVLDMAGNRVFTSKYSPEQADTQISFNRLPPGVYLLIGYYSDNKTESIKVIKI